MDLRSSTGTYMNAAKLEPLKAFRWTPGTTAVLGIPKLHDKATLELIDPVASHRGQKRAFDASAQESHQSAAKRHQGGPGTSSTNVCKISSAAVKCDKCDGCNCIMSDVFKPCHDLVLPTPYLHAWSLIETVAASAITANNLLLMLKSVLKLECASNGETKHVVRTPVKKTPFQKLVVLALRKLAPTDSDTRSKKSNLLAKVASALQVS